VAVKAAGDDTLRILQQAAALHRSGDLEGAEREYRRALKRQPRNFNALHLLGVIAEQRGRHAEAMTLIEQALAIEDAFPDAHFNLARIARSGGDNAKAERHTRRGLQLRPTATREHLNLSVLLLESNRAEEAAAYLRGMVTQNPGTTETYVQLGRAYRQAHDAEGMLWTARAGLERDPHHAVLHLLASEAHFHRGELQEGWRDYQWRFKSTENRVAGKSYPLPTWQGEELTDRRLLIWTEQGPGDEILYANMLPELIARSKACTVQCSSRLVPILQRSFPNARIVDRDLNAEDLHAFDLQTSLASGGEFLRSDFTSFPQHNGYIIPDPSLRDRLRAKYEAAGQGKCIVGIAWRSSGVENALNKSVGIAEWGPILHVPGITFVNLQYGDCRQELDAIAKGFGVNVIQDPEVDPLRDMDAYCAQVAAMDVVISSSNTAAHVAGALGIRTFCMLPRSYGHGCRWYWFTNHGNCPWYPALISYRQRRTGAWMDIIRDVGLALLDVSVSSGAIDKPGPYLRSIARAFTDVQRHDDAEAVYHRLGQEPGLAAEALYHIGNLRKSAEDLDGAMRFYDEAITADASFWHAYNAKGMLLANQLRFGDAIDVYRKALTCAPQSPEIHNNIGNAFRRSGQGEEALAHFREAHRLKPDLASIHLNVASTLEELGRTDEAVASFDALIARTPDYVEAHYNRALGLLSAGRFVEGWSAFPWRLKRPAANVRYEAFPQPVWQGEALTGHDVLVWTEQGIGDEILTATMLPDAIAKARHVTVLCSERMVPLMRRSFPTATVAERKEPLPTAARKPGIKWQMSQSELGLAFRRSWTDFPKRDHLLRVDPKQQAALRKKYQSARPGKRLVGISWRSTGNYEVGWLKGPELSAWAPILSANKDVAFVNLQYGDCRPDLEQVRETLGIDILHDTDVDPLRDMDRFAAQVAAMDLVISVSNTTVHAAGALGVPTWVLLAAGRGRMWYWFQEKSESPWYASLKLLRQTKAGDWGSLIETCAQHLAAWHGQP